MRALAAGKPYRALAIIDEAKKNKDLGTLLGVLDVSGNNTLIYAVTYPSRKVAARLYVEGMNPDTKNYKGRSARMLAYHGIEDATSSSERAIYGALVRLFDQPREHTKAVMTNDYHPTRPVEPGNIVQIRPVRALA